MKIALSGYYGFDNAGDEALLVAIPQSIARLEPSAEFVVFSGSPARTCQTHGIRAIHYMNPIHLIRELSQSDLLVSGGGSIFQDVTSARSLPYYISVVALARLLRKPVIFYAQGIGPINRRLSKFLMRIIANRVNIISLRDDKSRQLLLELGVVKPPLVVTADPVFSLVPGPQEEENIEKILARIVHTDKHMIGVSVRHWKALEKYQSLLANLLDELVLQGYQPIFIPMAYPDDIEASQHIMNLMKQPAVLVDRQLSSQEHLALIAKFDLLIGMRLHALIFAANRGIPFAGISYDPKIDAFLETFNQLPLPDNYINMKKQVLELLENQSIQEQIRQRSAQMRDKAEDNAKLALRLIKKASI